MWVMNTGIPSCRKLTRPAAAPCPLWRWGCPTLLLSLQLHGAGTSRHSKTPSYSSSRLGKVHGLKGTKFINLERHKSSQSSAPTSVSPGRIWECSLSPGQWQDTLLTKPPCDTILFPDFRWQLHSKSMDLLENSILYFSRWVWLDYGVGCLGWVFLFCLVWVCLGFFTIFIQTASMAV